MADLTIGWPWVQFSTRVGEIVPFKAGRQGVADKLAEYATGKIALEGRTALLDALMEGMRFLEAGQPGDVLFVATDGDDNSSRSQEREVQEAALCSGARVFVLLFVDPDRSARTIGFGPGHAEELSKTTGGFAVEPFALQYGTASRSRLTAEEAAEVGTRVRWLYELMGSYYRVEVELPVEVDKVRGWEVEVVDESGRKMKGARVVYPRKVAPCGDKKP